MQNANKTGQSVIGIALRTVIYATVGSNQQALETKSVAILTV